MERSVSNYSDFVTVNVSVTAQKILNENSLEFVVFSIEKSRCLCVSEVIRCQFSRSSIYFLFFFISNFIIMATLTVEQPK